MDLAGSRGDASSSLPSAIIPNASIEAAEALDALTHCAYIKLTIVKHKYFNPFRSRFFRSLHFLLHFPSFNPSMFSLCHCGRSMTVNVLKMVIAVSMVFIVGFFFDDVVVVAIAVAGCVLLQSDAAVPWLLKDDSHINYTLFFIVFIIYRNFMIS